MNRIAIIALLYATVSMPVFAAGDAQALADADALRRHLGASVEEMSTFSLLKTNGSFSLYGKLSHPRLAGAEDLAPPRNAATYGLHGKFGNTSKVGIRFGWDRYIAGDHAGNNLYSLTAVVKF